MEKESFEISEKDSNLLKLISQMVEGGVARGIKKGLEQQKKEEKLKDKITHDSRIKNTKLLFKNYRRLKEACEQATFTEKELETATVGEILDKIFCNASDEVTVVQSILNSKKRTEIILTHIDRIIRFYLFDAKMSKNDEKIRKANILNELYIKDIDKPKISDMSEKYNIGERQVHRDIKSAIEEISILIFGIDGIRKIY